MLINNFPNVNVYAKLSIQIKWIHRRTKKQSSSEMNVYTRYQIKNSLHIQRVYGTKNVSSVS